ncbi:hypothetical protein I8748_32025 [Nostoc sp. CENA67]|uniref:Uncharacterized protein n=1 Tax=Amazonocrinis nigriterrae CENA67 TaxID=2794033 RepID=A0A8J7HVP2_9NOST|nr:DUF6464 family protein [Amazonocrinis nigriterrae]MBH8566727.1 hypothetical protein [Amazonocrinis nigriterrae CENA67]
MSIRQRRRNRHKVKAALRQPTIKIICAGFTINMNEVNKAIAQVNKAIAHPGIREGMRKIHQDAMRIIEASQLGILIDFETTRAKLVDTGSLRSSFKVVSGIAKLVAAQEAELFRQYELNLQQYQLDQIEVQVAPEDIGNLNPFRQIVSAQRTARTRLQQCQAVQHSDIYVDDDVCLGDSSCRFNARSPHVQCAVNPKGDCASCRYFET